MFIDWWYVMLKGLTAEFNPVCNRTSDKKLDDRAITEKRRIAKLWKKGKFAMKDWQRKLRFVDLNYTFECDWLIELSDNNLADNNLASESVENTSFFKPITIEEIATFMISIVIVVTVESHFEFLISRQNLTSSIFLLYDIN